MKGILKFFEKIFQKRQLTEEERDFLMWMEEIPRRAETEMLESWGGVLKRWSLGTVGLTGTAFVLDVGHEVAFVIRKNGEVFARGFDEADLSLLFSFGETSEMGAFRSAHRKLYEGANSKKALSKSRLDGVLRK